MTARLKSFCTAESTAKQARTVHPSDDEAELIANGSLCGGDWETILRFQFRSSKEDLPRYKTITKQAQQDKKVKRFAAEERAAILETLQDGIDLDDTDGEEETEPDAYGSSFVDDEDATNDDTATDASADT